MMVVHLYSPDKSRDTLFISNYATLEITDAVTRVDGVGSIIVFGSPRLRHADLARSRPAAIGRPDRERRGDGAAGAERAGGLRRAQPAAGGQAGRVPDLGADARPPGRSGRVRQYRRQADGQCDRAGEGYRDGRTRGAGLFDQFLSRSRSGDRDRRLPAARLERAVDRARRSSTPWRTSPSGFRPA